MKVLNALKDFWSFQRNRWSKRIGLCARPAKVTVMTVHYDYSTHDRNITFIPDALAVRKDKVGVADHLRGMPRLTPFRPRPVAPSLRVYKCHSSKAGRDCRTTRSVQSQHETPQSQWTLQVMSLLALESASVSLCESLIPPHQPQVDLCRGPIKTFQKRSRKILRVPALTPTRKTRGN